MNTKKLGALAFLGVLIVGVTLISGCIEQEDQKESPKVTQSPETPTPVTAKAEIVNHGSYMYSATYHQIFGGTWSGEFPHIVGEIQNVSTINIRVEKIDVVFYDTSGAVIEDMSCCSLKPYLPDILTPGQKFPFRKVLLDEQVSKEVASYEFSIESIKAKEEPLPVKLVSYDMYQHPPPHEHIHEIYGEVQNTGDENINSPTVWASFYDEDGRIIDAHSFWVGAELGLDVLRPGEKSPFLIDYIPRNDIVDKIKSCELIIKSNATDEASYREFEILSHKAEIEPVGALGNCYVVTGEVKNTGDQDVSHVNIIASFYDAEGNLIATGWTLVGEFGERDLNAGETGTFELRATPEREEILDKITEYTLQVEALKP
jgi:hypothetical protein